MSFASPAFDEQALAAFADSVVGAGLGPEAMALIEQAGQLREQPEAALSCLQQARRLAPRHLVPVIAVYRFHFYAHELALARAAGEDALALARHVLGPDFGDEPPSDEATRHDAAVRFYLFTLKGLAYLNLRLGDWPQAWLMLGELRRLDPQDRVGGSLLLQVLERREAGEDLDAPLWHEGDPVRGWRPRS